MILVKKNWQIFSTISQFLEYVFVFLSKMQVGWRFSFSCGCRKMVFCPLKPFGNSFVTPSLHNMTLVYGSQLLRQEYFVTRLYVNIAQDCELFKVIKGYTNLHKTTQGYRQPEISLFTLLHGQNSSSPCTAISAMLDP